MITATDIDRLFDDQLARWELAQNNYDNLHNAITRQLCEGDSGVWGQHNAGGITSLSSMAIANKDSMRPCFLCEQNLPPEQLRLDFNDEFRVLVNPYPIFQRHFTLPSTHHTPQRIASRIATMLDMAQQLTPYTIFYNGPRCGASAPMHMHFQAAQKGVIPVESVEMESSMTLLGRHGESRLGLVNDTLRPIFLIQSPQRNEAEYLFSALYKALPPIENEEPMMNIIARYDYGQWRMWVFPRAKHRPECYYATDESQRLISPGAVEMGGLFIAPREEDYTRLTWQEIAEIYAEVTPSPQEITQIANKIEL